MIWGNISRYVNGENVLGCVACKNKSIYLVEPDSMMLSRGGGGGGGGGGFHGVQTPSHLEKYLHGYSDIPNSPNSPLPKHHSPTHEFEP